MNTKLIIAITVAALLLLSVLVAVPGISPATAAPQAIPTPVGAAFSGGRSNVVTWMSASAVTTDTFSNLQNVQEAEAADVQYVIDQGTTNTVTLKLQFSNDGANWVDGATVVSANAADANNMLQFAVFGRYARIHADVTNSNPLTLTVNAVTK